MIEIAFHAGAFTGRCVGGVGAGIGEFVADGFIFGQDGIKPSAWISGWAGRFPR